MPEADVDLAATVCARLDECVNAIDVDIDTDRVIGIEAMHISGRDLPVDADAGAAMRKAAIDAGMYDRPDSDYKNVVRRLDVLAGKINTPADFDTPLPDDVLRQLEGE